MFKATDTPGYIKEEHYSNYSKCEVDQNNNKMLEMVIH